MKKLACLVLGMLLLCGMAFAETDASHHHAYLNDDIPVKSGWWYREWDAGIEYRVYYERVCEHCGETASTYTVIPDAEVPKGGVQVCPHDVFVREMLLVTDIDWAREIAEDITGFISAVCSLCNEDYLFYEGDATGLVCDGRTHIYQREPEIIEEGLYLTGKSPDGILSSSHVYRTYYRAKCVGCSAQLKCHVYSKNEDGTTDFRGEEHHLLEVASYHKPDSTKHVSVMKCTVCGYSTGYETVCNVYLSGLCSEEMKKAWEFYNEK